MRLLAAILSTLACFGTYAGVALLGSHGGAMAPLAILWTIVAVAVLWRSYRQAQPSRFALVAIGAPLSILTVVPISLFFVGGC